MLLHVIFLRMRMPLLQRWRSQAKRWRASCARARREQETRSQLGGGAACVLFPTRARGPISTADPLPAGRDPSHPPQPYSY